eukprot:1157222-Pelagomonas_calceolata.AAC.1
MPDEQRMPGRVHVLAIQRRCWLMGTGCDRQMSEESMFQPSISVGGVRIVYLQQQAELSCPVQLFGATHVGMGKEGLAKQQRGAKATVLSLIWAFLGLLDDTFNPV